MAITLAASTYRNAHDELDAIAANFKARLADLAARHFVCAPTFADELDTFDAAIADAKFEIEAAYERDAAGAADDRFHRRGYGA